MYNKKEAKRLLDLGKNYKATHLIIFYDSFEGDEIYRYVSRGQTVEEVLRSVLKYGPAYGVEAIFNYDLDLEEQLKEDCPRHNEPSKEYKINYDIALEYATKKHEGKFRKGNPPTPYIVHPIEVSKMISNYMKNDVDEEAYKVAALLHDTLEDSDATYEEEYNLFGKQVADIVLSVTSDKKKQKELGKDIYLSEKMVDMKEKDLILKLCDRLDNVSGLNITSEEFNEKYIRETTFIINYLLLNRKLNETHLKIINDIMRKIKEVSYKDPMIIEPRKKKLSFEEK